MQTTQRPSSSSKSVWPLAGLVSGTAPSAGADGAEGAVACCPAAAEPEVVEAIGGGLGALGRVDQPPVQLQTLSIHSSTGEVKTQVYAWSTDRLQQKIELGW